PPIDPCWQIGTRRGSCRFRGSHRNGSRWFAESVADDFHDPDSFDSADRWQRLDAPMRRTYVKHVLNFGEISTPPVAHKSACLVEARRLRAFADGSSLDRVEKVRVRDGRQRALLGDGEARELRLLGEIARECVRGSHDEYWVHTRLLEGSRVQACQIEAGPAAIRKYLSVRANALPSGFERGGWLCVRDLAVRKGVEYRCGDVGDPLRTGLVALQRG